MADRKIGRVAHRHDLSPALAIFRLMPAEGSAFPSYRPGQYIALRREDCKLTKKVRGPDGCVVYRPNLDEQGVQKSGPVAHAYSIASAPFETEQHGFLEFYVVLESSETGLPGRLTESLWQVDPRANDTLIYFDRITGEFTLERRAAGFRNVVMVGTGTGLAPFVSMVKQLHHDASLGQADRLRYTLIHANRSRPELGYHEELEAIHEARLFDFVYVGSVSRPSGRDVGDASLGKGRANNLLRLIFDRPLKEEQDLTDAAGRNEDVSTHEAALKRTVRPVLPARVTKEQLRDRMPPGETVLFCCGNLEAAADVRTLSGTHGIKFEFDEW